MQKLVPYLDKVVDWEKFGYQLLPEDKEHLVQVYTYVNNYNSYFVYVPAI